MSTRNRGFGACNARWRKTNLSLGCRLVEIPEQLVADNGRGYDKFQEEF